MTPLLCCLCFFLTHLSRLPKWRKKQFDDIIDDIITSYYLICQSLLQKEKIVFVNRITQKIVSELS